MNKALVFSIEEFSVFDGPGIRSTVFLKGCPLRCEWCHNPEGQSFDNEILRSPNGCRSCGNCQKFANNQNGKYIYTPKSIDACAQGLLRYAAIEYSAEELCKKLLKNQRILNSSGGGVTFSGGEPTASPNFLIECLDLLEGHIHRAIQSCGYCAPHIFKSILNRCDYVLFDLKLIDCQLHERYTGLPNAPILENFAALASSDKEFVVRMPLIPTVTDTDENIRAIAELMSTHGAKHIELMPYNKMAGAKYPLAGKEYSPSFDTQAPVNTSIEIFQSCGITAKIL